MGVVIKPCGICGGERVVNKQGKNRCQNCAERWRRNNKHRTSGYQKTYKDKHGDSIKEKRRSWIESNAEHNREYHKKYRVANREKRVEYNRNYHKEKSHPDKLIWKNMKQRCLNPNDPGYKNYGGRGIKICDRWLDSFDNFINDMKERPHPRHLYSIERKDVDGNYEPGNCIWATQKIQAANRRDSRSRKVSIPDNSPIYLGSELMTIKEFSEKTGIHLTAVKYRYALHPNSPDWIMNSDTENRFFEFEGHLYNAAEISLMCGLSYSKTYDRLFKLGHNVERLMGIR